MFRTVWAVVVLGILVVAFAPAAAAAENPWLGKRVMNMAHQGGEDEAPSSTMYAFKRAAGLGADMLELDVHATLDGQLMVIHDARVDRTTNGSGFVGDMTAAQVQALDAGYNFVPGRNAVANLPPESYPFRGVRAGLKPPPSGYSANDFRIPTLQEVFQTFPNIPINIEIKGRSDADVGSFLRHAELLADFLKASGRTDVIVVSFNDLAVERFHQLAPRIGVAPGVAGIARFTAGLPLGDGVVALQVPPTFEGVPVATPDFVRDAHARGYAVHVWPSEGEDDAFYDTHLAMCADGLMPSRPSGLEALLRRRSIIRPGKGGSDPCGTAAAGSGGVAPACAARPLKLGRVSRRGRVRVRLRRAGRGRSRCVGTVSLRTNRRFKGKRGRRVTLRVGVRRFSMAARRLHARPVLRVSRRGRRLLRRGRGLGVTAVVRMRGATASKGFRLRRAAARRTRRR